jgi:hypothetical protein
MNGVAAKEPTRIERSMVHKDGTRRLKSQPQRPMNEGDNPTWNEMRFTAEAVAKCIEYALYTQRGIPRPNHDLLKTLAENLNADMDRDSNRHAGVFDNLDFENGMNVSLSAVQATLWLRMRNTAATLYQAIELCSDYGGIERDSPFGIIRGILENEGCCFPPRESKPPRRGRPRVDWRRNGWRWAGWVAQAMESAGYRETLAPTKTNSTTAAIGAEIVKRAYGSDVLGNSEFTSADFAEGLRKVHRDRRKRTEYDDLRAEITRIKIID